MALKNEVSKNSDTQLASFLIRAGLAITFLYASVSAFLDPGAWVGFIPKFIKEIINPGIFLHIHSVGEVILSLWLLSNKKIFYASIASALALIGIIIFNISALDILFRDIALLFAAFALAALSYKER